MITTDQLKQALLDQREAILKKPLGIEREANTQINSLVRLPHVIVLTGLRRSGKSTLLRQIIHNHYKDKDFYYVNFEDERLYGFQAQDFNRIYEALLELFGEKKTFFVDEIQNVPGFQSFVRRFNENGFKFFITGSSAELLSKEIGTKLTGRHLDLTIKPFSFKEYLKLKNVETNEKTTSRAKIKKHFNKFLFEGGMPEYAIYENPEILSKIYEDILMKDVVVRHGIDDIRTLKELYQYLITTANQKFSYNSLTKFVGIKSDNTIRKYINYLEQTHFIKVLNKFDYSLKKQLVNDKKIYVVDNGFIPKISVKFTEDKGWLLENLIFNELTENVFYYSGKKECDFIITKNNKVTSAIQVCWELSTQNKEREVNGLLEAMNKFDLNEGLILTSDQKKEILVEGKKIIVIPAWEWLLKTKP